jgi:hypothetical protein
MATHNRGLLALFVYVDDFLSALRGLKVGSYRIETAFSPLHLPEIQEILEKKPSAARFITLLGALAGALGVMALAIYSHLSFNLITGGKPVLPWTPWVVVAFEGAILGAVISAVIAWILKGRLPRLRPADGYDPLFSQDRFGILVACTGDEEEEIRKLLAEAGAGEVRHVEW